MAAEIKVSNVGTREYAEPLRRLFEGQTYMKFTFKLCPVGGSFDVLVGTLDPDYDEAELTGMVLMVMAGDIMRKGSV